MSAWWIHKTVLMKMHCNKIRDMKNCTQLCEMIKNQSMVLNTPVWNEPPHCVNNDDMIDFSNQWDIPTETLIPDVYIQTKCLTSLLKLTRRRLTPTHKKVQITLPPTCQTMHTRGNIPKTYREYGATEVCLYVSSHACSKLLAPSDKAINISDSTHNDIPRRTQSPLIAIEL